MTVNLKARIFTGLLLFIVVFIIFSFKFFLVYSLIVLGILSLIEFTSLINYFIKKRCKIFGKFSIYYLYFIFLYDFYNFFRFFKTKNNYFFFTNVLRFFGYRRLFFWETFFRSKLTKISPNKTLSGSVWIHFFSVLIFSLLMFYYTKSINLNIFIVAIITSLACQFGDLFFSYLKRLAKVKDTGNFFSWSRWYIRQDRWNTYRFANWFLILCIYKMKKIISILGSTGSIGLTSLSIIDKKKIFLR